MRQDDRRSPMPIYTFALVWLICSMLFPLLRAAAFVLTIAASVGAAFLMKAILKKALSPAENEETATAESPVEEGAGKESHGEEVDAIIRDGRVALREMGRLYNSIQNPAIRSKINEIMSISDKIIQDAIEDKHDVPQIRKFLDYYLPTTIKLLNAYDRMDAQAVEGENISGSKQRIEDMLDTTIEAYKKHLDSLFANQALDVDAEIRAMNGMMAREGLAGDSYLDLKDFMKQYEQQQKGSTENG